MLAPGTPDFLGVSGISRWRTSWCDRASNTALTAAGAGTVVTDPMPFTPSGLVGEGIATVCSIHSGMALARSRVESIPHITALSSCGHEDENEGNLSRHGYVIIANHSDENDRVSCRFALQTV